MPRECYSCPLRAPPACAPPLSRPPACLRWILATCGIRARAPADAGLLRKVDGSDARKRNRFGIWLAGPAEPACSTRSRRRCSHSREHIRPLRARNAECSAARALSSHRAADCVSVSCARRVDGHAAPAARRRVFDYCNSLNLGYRSGDDQRALFGHRIGERVSFGSRFQC